MNFKSHLPNPHRVSGLRGFVSALLLSAFLAVPPFAGAGYLTSGQPDGVALLPPPPALDSSEQAADLASARAVFKGRTPAEESRALADASLRIFSFTPAIGEFFQPGKFPKTEAFFEKVKTNISEVINIPKNEWKRKRPYQLDNELSFAKPEASFSYPSGHSTRGTMQALLLAELFPDKRDAILEHGREIGWDRVLIGVHFPTDVYAGRVLGQAIVRELMASPEFQKDLAEAKAEVQAARR